MKLRRDKKNEKLPKAVGDDKLDEWLKENMKYQMKIIITNNVQLYYDKIM
ncbi:MAG: hypothetical protein QM737_11855 [Ferruginibacter sp.]